MTNIEELGRDPHSKVSSQPTIKRGEDRGYRKPEVGGTWICASGYTYEASQESKYAHTGWIEAVTQLGLRVGCYQNDGVVDYYIFKENNHEKG